MRFISDVGMTQPSEASRRGRTADGNVRARRPPAARCLRTAGWTPSDAAEGAEICTSTRLLAHLCSGVMAGEVLDFKVSEMGCFRQASSVVIAWVTTPGGGPTSRPRSPGPPRCPCITPGGALAALLGPACVSPASASVPKSTVTVWALK